MIELLNSPETLYTPCLISKKLVALSVDWDRPRDVAPALGSTYMFLGELSQSLWP